MDPKKILVLEDYGRGSIEELVRRDWPVWATPYAAPAGMAKDVRAAVEINHGRWIVHCPMLGCEGAQMASLRRRFFCVDCLHTGDPRAAGKWIAVEWPTNPDEIVVALLKRPHERNRNWRPGEEVRQLLVENAAFVSEDQHLGAVVDSFMSDTLEE